ncbi:MAG TPA: lysophospholipid acyltransferase family protein [Anaerolineae bacterium]
MENSSSPRLDAVAWRDSVTWYTYETQFAKKVRAAGKIVFSRLARIECVGLENVPAEGGCIVASNHINNFDVIFLSLYSPRFLHFMAKMELYKNPIIAWIIRLGGSFPVQRGEKDAWALQQAGRVLNRGQVLFMFPEGTRSGKKAQLRRGKIGAIKLAVENRVPIVPTAIFGTEHFQLRLKHSNEIRLEFGQPLDVAALAGPPPYEYGTFRDLTTVLMERIAALLPPAHRGIYGD